MSTAPNTEPTINSALTLLGASTADDACDVYMPPRILRTLRDLHDKGQSLGEVGTASIQEARRSLAAAFNQSAEIPTPPRPSEDEIVAAMRSIQRQALNLSEPPPARHVAYFTHQLRRAFTQAYQQGWNRGRETRAAALEALDAERRAAPMPTTERQEAATDTAKTIFRQAAA